MKTCLDQTAASSSQSSETQEKDDRRETLLRPPNMSVNSSSFADLPTPPPPHLPPNASSHPLLRCFSSRTGVFAFSALSITYAFLLPLLVLVLYLGFQQWRRRRSTSTSHSDVFTFHSIAMQLNEVLGFAFLFCGGYVKLIEMMLLGNVVGSVTSLTQALFHLLTCVERYLAVVHPVTYLGLRRAGGVRIRNISVACVWFLSVGCLVVETLASSEVIFTLYICVVTFILLVVSFCSISVLCALKRPGPGEVGGNRERVDQSKQRAFNTIMVITAVLLLRFGASFFLNVMNSSSVVTDMCVVFMSDLWFSLPSSLVLPLLFLHRAGKLQCCRRNAEAG